MLLLIIVLVLLFGGGGGYFGYSRWGTSGGLGIVGTVLLWYPLLTLLLRTLRLTYKYQRRYPEELWGAGGVLIMLVVLSLTDNTVRGPGVMILALAPVSVALNRTLYLRSDLSRSRGR